MDSFSEAYLTRLKESIEQNSDYMLAGDVKNYEEYRHISGVLKGLKIALREYKELLSLTGAEED